MVPGKSIEEQLAFVMGREPRLSYFGIGTFDGDRYSAVPEAERLASSRDELRRNVSDVAVTVEWLQKNVAPTRAINTKRTSYGIKHTVEDSLGRYISNGVLIAAAIIVGYPYRVYPGEPNVCFGMSKRSLRIVEEERRRKRGSWFAETRCDWSARIDHDDVRED